MEKRRKKRLRPFEQGRLDALCGVYSLINADKIVNRKSDSHELYQNIIEYLDNKKKLKQALIEGTFFRSDVKPIVNEFFSDRWEFKFPYSGVRTPILSEFWNSMQHFLSKDKNRAIIIAIKGRYDHWTVIHEISNNKINLHDSSGLGHLLRLNCTTGEETRTRHHVLLPAQTIFISKKEEPTSDS